MRFEAARAEGERVVAELLRKFRQDTGNAKWIGRMALSNVEQRFTKSSDSSDAVESDDTIAVAEAQDAQVLVSSPVSLPSWSILSASELIEFLATCSRDDAEEILEAERVKLGRASVIEAASRRLG